MDADILQTVLTRKVRSVAAYGDARAEALIDFAAGARCDWSYAEWNDMLHSLDACNMTVADFVALG